MLEIIDSQIHVWEKHPPPGRPWDGDALRDFPGGGGSKGPRHLQTIEVETAIAAMDAVGVDAAVLSVLPYYRTLIDGSYFRYDNTYGEEAARRFPDRFCSVLRVDPADPDLEAVLEQGMRGFGVVGMREVVTTLDKVARLKAGGYDRLFKAAEDQNIPMMIVVQPELWAAAKAAREHPRLRLILDHVGLVQPGMHRPPDPNPLEQLPQVLALSGIPNIFLKITGIVTLSKESFPFADLQAMLSQLLSSFGPERLIWGSDFHRTKPRTYADAVDFLKYNRDVSEGDKELIMGANLRRILNWQRYGNRNPPDD